MADLHVFQSKQLEVYELKTAELCLPQQHLKECSKESGETLLQHSSATKSDQISIIRFHSLLSRAKSEIHFRLVDSRANWDIFAQFIYSLTLHTLNAYMIRQGNPY